MYIIRAIYNTPSMTFDEMLEKSNMLSVKLDLFRPLVIEMFKCVEPMNPSYMNGMFAIRNSNYNLRNPAYHHQLIFNTFTCGKNHFIILASKYRMLFPPVLNMLTTCRFSRAMF